MTEPCCRAGAIRVRRNMREALGLLKGIVLVALLGMGLSWLAYVSGLIGGDWFASSLAFWLGGIIGAPPWAALLLLGLCWRDARRWDKEHQR